MNTLRTVAALVLGGLVLGCTRRTVIVETRAEPTAVVTGAAPAAVLDVPPGHLPRPGECRIWIPGNPPGRQPRPKSRPCEGIAALAPAGSWILYRPTDARWVHVRVVDERRAGVIIRVRVYETESGRFVREENP